MRLFATIGLLGAFVSIASLQAQSLAEHGAAAAGATIGTAAGKPISNAVTKIFGQTEDQTRSASKAGSIKKDPFVAPATATAPAPAVGSGPGPSPLGASGGSSGDAAGSPEASERQAAASARRAVRLRRQRETAAIESQAALPPPIAAPAPVELVKEPTPEEVAGIQVGANERDVVAALGVPASRVTVPDDDGHLRESYQYWAKGSQIGTVRLDNGVVVKVEARRF